MVALKKRNLLFESSFGMNVFMPITSSCPDDVISKFTAVYMCCLYCSLLSWDTDENENVSPWDLERLPDAPQQGQFCCQPVFLRLPNTGVCVRACVCAHVCTCAHIVKSLVGGP